MNTLIDNNIQSEYQLIPPIQERWSPRALKSDTISDQQMEQIFEAGRWAPSSNNLQPWRFIWAKKGSEDYNQLFDLLAPFNKSWVPPAPILILAGYYKYNPNGDENFHALYDLGQSVAFMTLQAHHLDIAFHQMGGFDHEKANELYGNKDHHFATMIACGKYGGDIELLPEDLQAAEQSNRSRKPLKDLVAQGRSDALINHKK